MVHPVVVDLLIATGLYQCNLFVKRHTPSLFKEDSFSVECKNLSGYDLE